MLGHSPSCFEFWPFRLDLGRRTLWRTTDGARIALNSRTFDTLATFVQRPGEVLDRDYLLRTVWADAVVEEKNLTVQIAALRKALGDDPQAPEFIATVPGRGYQFIAPVRSGEVVPGLVVPESKVPDASPLALAVGPAPGSSPAPSRRPRRSSFAVIGLAVAIAGVGVWRETSSRPDGIGDLRSIAILPVRSLIPSGNDQNAHLEIGLADALITRLSRLGGLTIRPTSAIRRYAAPDADARKAGLDLQVDAVVDAHLHRESDRVRLTARLIRVRDGAALWADTFDEASTNLFALEDALSERLAAALSLTLPASGDARKRPAPPNAKAYEAYLKGRFFWSKWTRDGLEKAVGHFRDAIRADPAFAHAHAGLADSYQLQAYLRFVPARSASPLAAESARRALELDDAPAEAHLVKAKTLFFYDWDFAGARRQIDHALRLEPEHADAHAFNGAYLLAMGDFAGSHRERATALAFDPVSALATNAIGWTYQYEKRHSDALEWFRKASELDPLFVTAHHSRAELYFMMGQDAEAVEAMLAARKAAGAADEELALTKAAFERGGLRGYWQEALRRATTSTSAPVDAFRVARIHYELGDFDQAMRWFERSFEARDSLLVFLKINPQFARLQSDQRFQGLIKRIGL